MMVMDITKYMDDESVIRHLIKTWERDRYEAVGKLILPPANIGLGFGTLPIAYYIAITDMPVGMVVLATGLAGIFISYDYATSD